MEEGIEISIEYSDKDIRQSMSYFILHIRSMWVFYLCLLILTGFILVISAINGFSGFYSYLPLVFIVIDCILYLLYYLKPINQYVNYYKRSRKQVLFIFRKNDISTVGNAARATYEWSVFKRAHVTPYSLLLVDSNRFVHILPKNQINSKEDYENLQKFFTNKVGPI